MLKKAAICGPFSELTSHNAAMTKWENKFTTVLSRFGYILKEHTISLNELKWKSLHIIHQAINLKRLLLLGFTFFIVRDFLFRDGINDSP